MELILGIVLSQTAHIIYGAIGAIAGFYYATNHVELGDTEPGAFSNFMLIVMAVVVFAAFSVFLFPLLVVAGLLILVLYGIWWILRKAGLFYANND